MPAGQRGVGVDITSEGVTESVALIEAMASNTAAVPRTLERDVRATFARSAERRFAAQGPGWASLDEDTIERKTREGYRRPSAILRASDRLYNGLRHPEVFASATGVRVGAPVWYGIFAQAGTTYEPQREVAGLSAEDVERLSELVARAILGGRL